MTRRLSTKVAENASASSLQQELLEIIDRREVEDKRQDRAIWKHCSLEEFAESWRNRVNKMADGKWLFLNQMDGSSLCGATSVAQNLVLSEPANFVHFAMDLYKSGKATFNAPGAQEITVPKRITSTDPRASKDNPVDFDWLDWIVLASIRSNVHKGVRGVLRQIFPLRTPVERSELHNVLHVSAIPGDVQEMYGMFGFGKDKISRDAHSMRLADQPGKESTDNPPPTPAPDSRTAQLTASRLFKEGQMLSLFINSSIKRLDSDPNKTLEMTESRKKELRKTEKKPNHHHATATHWITLSSEIESQASTVQFKYIDYGSEKLLRVTQAQFTNHFYGYIAVAPRSVERTRNG